MKLRPALLLVLVAAIMATASAVVGYPSGAAEATRLADLAEETPAPTSPWLTQWGGFNYVERLQAVTADSVWAVGSNVVHFDGIRWRAVDRRDYPAELNGVSILSDGTGWIVGDEEEVIPVRDGVAMASTHVPGYRFRDVATVDDAEAWALAITSSGSRAVILHYRGGAWTPEWTAPPMEYLSSIWMASPNEGWAVGSTAVYYNGETWTEWSLPVQNADLHEVQGTGPTDVWAVGGRMPVPLLTPRRLILHFDGSGWSVTRDEKESGIYALALRPGEGFAVSTTGDVLALRDGRWEELLAKVPAATWPQVPVWVTAASFVPGAPYALVTTSEGWVYRLQGDEVTLVRDASAFTSVAMIDDHHGWVIGHRAMQYDGTEWQELPAGSDLHQAIDIAAAPNADVWAVGAGGLVLHYQSAEWQPVAFPFVADLKRVAFSESGTVWVLGQTTSESATDAASVIYTRDDTEGWAERWRGPGTVGDLAVAHGWALVSTSEGIWWFDGTSWSQARETGALSVGIGAAGELWAGEGGEIQELAPGGWTTRAWLPAGAGVRAFAPGGRAMWAVADLGFVLAHDDAGWRIVRGDGAFSGLSGARYALHDISAVPMPDGQIGLWAVGEPDTILHALESDVLQLPAITPEPTREPYPTSDWRPTWIYLPSVDRQPAHRSAACRQVAGASVDQVESSARTTARYYARGGPVPEPTLSELHMGTVAEMIDRHGVNLVGTEVRGQLLSPVTCIWWASFEGRFDDAPPGATPRAPDYSWTRLDLALFSDDASVIYEEFSGKGADVPPSPSAPPGPPTVTPVPTPP